MRTTEVLTPEILDGMPDAELLLRMQRLRINVASLSMQIAEHREASFGRSPDWRICAESRLKDLEAALQQVRDEGKRRLQAARRIAA